MSPNSPKILVTGGAGFIGSHVCEALLSRGLAIRVLDDLSTGRQENLPDNPLLEMVAGDISNRADLRSAMKGIERCAHFAGKVSVPYSLEHPQDSANTNVVGFVNLLQCAREADVSRIIYASSAAVYGNPENMQVAETDRATPISPYGLEKLVMEQYARLFRSIYGLSSLGMRLFNVYGPRQDPKSPYSGVITRFLSCIQSSEPIQIFGKGNQTRDFIHVRDVATLSCRALESDGAGICNIGTGKARSVNDIVEMFRQALAKPLECQHRAEKPADILHSCADTHTMHKLLGTLDHIDMAKAISDQIFAADQAA